MFCSRCCNRSRMSALSDCGRWTPLRYWAPPLHLGPSPTTNWNRVSEKSSFVTLFNLGLLAPPSRRWRSNTSSSERKVRRRSVGERREGGYRCCWLQLLEKFVSGAMLSVVHAIVRQCHRSVDGFHLQKKQEADISVVSLEKPKEAGVQVSGRYTMYIKQGLVDGGKRNSGPLEWSPPLHRKNN